MKAISRILDWRLRRFEASPAAGRRILEAAKDAGKWIGKDRRTDIVRDIQLLRLKRTLCWVYDRSPFYRERFRLAGCRPDDLRDQADLVKFPFTTPADLLNPRSFLCIPESRCSALFLTSGTTGEPKAVYLTREEMDAQANLGAVILRALMPGKLVAWIALPQGLWIGWAEARRIVEQAGGLPLPAGTVLPAEALDLMRRFQPNLVISSPSYMAALTREADRRGFRIPLDWIMLSSESLTEDHAGLFRSYWDAKVLDVYGATEIGGGQTVSLENCTAMHLNELALYPEIVDPATGRPADRGELAFTTLSRAAMPLVRYRIGDLAGWHDCGCPLPLRGIVLAGRADDMIPAGGVLFSGRVFLEKIGAVPGAGGRLRLEMDRDGLTDRVRVCLEGRDADAGEVRDALFKTYPEMERSIRIGGLILEIQAGADLREQVKSLKIVDRRKIGDAPVTG